MKRLIAFSSVAHMGFVMLGIATLTPLGFNAAIFGMVAHGLITGMLFFIAGSVKDRYHTLEIKRLGGMLKQMPKMGWILGFCAMASLGLPGLAGFWGEFPAIVVVVQPVRRQRRAPGAEPRHLPRLHGDRCDRHRARRRLPAVAVPAGGVRRADATSSPVTLPPAHSVGAAGNESLHDDHGSDITDVKLTEWIAWTPFLVGILVLGIYPQLLFKILDPATQVALRAFGG